MSAADTNRIVRSVQRKAGDVMVVAAQNAFIRSAKKLEAEMPAIINKMVQAFDLRYMSRGTFLHANQVLAKTAQTEMVAGYHSRLPRQSPHYRAGGYRGRLVGRLGATLASTDMTSSTTDRVISFINITTLNAEAAHFYRVNYGASGPNLNLSGGHKAGTFPVLLGGHHLFSLHDTSAPAPRSFLPRMFIWQGIGESDEFFEPTLGPATTTGKGHRAAYFTDIGLEVIARDFGAAYQEMYNVYLRSVHTERAARTLHVPVEVAFPG